MAQCRAMGRNAVSVLFLTFLLFYIAYFTSELYTRLNNIRKLERLNSYERELTELTQLVHQYKNEAYTVGQSVVLLEEVITKMADASRRRRNKLQTRDGANHARQDDIERQLRILDRPLSFRGDRVRHGQVGQPRLSDGVNYGKAGQPDHRSHLGDDDDHRLQNIDHTGGGGGVGGGGGGGEGEEEAYAGDKVDGNYNSDNLQSKQFVGRNSKKYESLVAEKLTNNGKGRGPMKQNSVR